MFLLRASLGTLPKGGKGGTAPLLDASITQSGEINVAGVLLCDISFRDRRETP